MTTMTDFRLTRRAVQDTPIDRVFLRDTALSIEEIVPQPKQPWVVRGPRGGRYLALPPFRLRVSEEVSDYFIRNQVVARWDSAGTRYIRPGSRLSREVESALDNANPIG